MEMEWLLQNLDAYRIVAEILNSLRKELRRALEAEFGSSWPEEGVPSEVMARLIERKEQEKAIDWHESEYQEITSFAGFVDVLEILQANPKMLPEFMNLASNPALLYARFIELEVITSKLGLARAVGESELSFLGTFHVRFRKALEILRERRRKPSQDHTVAKPEPEPAPRPKAETEVKTSPPPPAEPQEELKADQPATATVPAVDERPAASPADTPAASPTASKNSSIEFTEQLDEKPAAAEQQPPPVPAEKPPVRVANPNPRPQRPPMRPASSPSGSMSAVSGNGASYAAARKPATPPPAAAPTKEEASDVPETTGQSSRRLDQALEEGNSQIILKELYREITYLAEGVWSCDVIPVPYTWNKVCASIWYEKSFSRLGLKPLSDFYSIINKIDERIQEGATREQLQELLKENHFAQVLLLLRDMFQRNRV